MRIVLAALALATAAPAALADVAQPVSSAASAALGTRSVGHHQRMYLRYCEKLREGPEAYAAFVRRMATVTGYTFTDFAPRDAHDTVRYHCRPANGAMAAVSAR